MINKKQIFQVTKKENSFLKKNRIFWAYFLFLFKVVTRHFTNWLLFVVYVLVLFLILVIIPLILDASPAGYWNNPIIYVVSFIMPIAALLISSVSLDVFRDGIDNGTELVIIAKPVGRLHYVLAKFLLLVIVSIFFSLISSFVGLFTFAVPRMDKSLVGDLVAGIFTGTFVNGLFFASIAILLSMRLHKYATNLIIITVTLILSLMTTLSRLFFSPPYEILSNQGINLVQQEVETKKPGNASDHSSNIVYQVQSTFGATNFTDIKTAYNNASNQTFYYDSYYLNIGNMVNSLYNLNGLATYNNANIALSPPNAKWNIGDKININDFYHLSLGFDTPELISNNNPSSNNTSIIPAAFRSQIVFLPAPSRDTTSLLSRFIPSASYRYLVNPITNETKSENATPEMFAFDPNNLTVVNQTLINAVDSLSLLTNPPAGSNSAGLVNPFANITSSTTEQQFMNDLLQLFQSITLPNNMVTFRDSFENKVEDKNNAVFGKNVLQQKINLFYGLDTIRQISQEAQNELLQASSTIDFVSKIGQIRQSFEKVSGFFNELLEKIVNPMVLSLNNTDVNNALVLLSKLLGLPQNLINQFTSSALLSDNIKKTALSAIYSFVLFNNYASIYLLNLVSTARLDVGMVRYRTSLGLFPVQQNQVNSVYLIKSVPIVPPSAIITTMVVIAFGLFIGISFIYFYRDIK
ncbi:ABC transporter permease [[Mycoplasma] testudinis]|uniref:ABC transporter permease n=1 Tax=[Mycoplasma] testudinis TaxID=33924 RepID=UPI0004874B02|nr:ABC transporter permease [[Mycoplasma] testudinis]